MRAVFSRAQSGFSLVEVMISLTVGLILTAGVIQIVVSSQVTEGLNRAMAEAQENGRYIMGRLRNELITTGRYDTLDPDLDTSVDVVEEAAFLQNRPVVLAGDFSNRESLGSVQGSSGGNDTLVIAKQGLRDCRGYKLGYATDAEFFVVNEYFVEDGTLKCRGFDGRVLRGQKVASGNNGDAAFTLLDNVLSFQVVYGISASPANGDVTGQPLSYITADQLDAQRTAGANVVSLRIAIVVEGQGDVKIDTPPTFKLLNEASFTPSDHGLYKKFEATISLRNMKHYVRNRKA
ncbi:PilW family protein [Planctobacterium marinum]|uniref:PilW family protein n=1 Tax=Planctobacterium marinum TaxID=1631968 RepID=UPI001E6545C6|nr:PilW family protein [Planctobacterium marinum]MCC2605482.1 PilW family protein [Planctobacterium marinum]